MASTRIADKPLVVLERDEDTLRVEDPDITLNLAYKYEPLPDAHHIRLLELKPGRKRDKLECEISTYLLDAQAKPPLYRAVSYTWLESEHDQLLVSGVSDPLSLREHYSIRHPVWCGGRRLLISTNLRDALRRFRHGIQPVRLWVDSLCINQEDDDERSQQVLMIQRIYHLAISVWLWLGEADGYSDTAIEWLAKVCAVEELITLQSREHPLPFDLDNGPTIQEAGLAVIRAPAWKAVLRLLQRPVFQRIWIVQEVMINGRVIAHCGKSRIDFSIIARAVEFIGRCSLGSELSSYYDPGGSCISYLIAIRKLQREWLKYGSNTRRHLIQHTNKFRASDPRDKVYALLGLINDFAHRQPCNLELCGNHMSIGMVRDLFLDANPNSDLPAELDKMANELQNLLERFGEARSLRREQEAAEYLRDVADPDTKSTYSEYFRRLREILNIISPEPESGDLTVSTANFEILAVKNMKTSLFSTIAKSAEHSDAFIDILGPVLLAFNDIEHLVGFGDSMERYLYETSKLRVYICRILGILERQSEGADNASDVVEAGSTKMRAAPTKPQSDLEIFENLLKSCSLESAYFDQILISFVRAYLGDKNEWVQMDSGLWIRDPENKDTRNYMVAVMWPYRVIVTVMEDVPVKADTGNRNLGGNSELHPGRHGEAKDKKCARHEIPLQERDAISSKPFQPWSSSSPASRTPTYRLPVADVYREFTLRCLMEDSDLFMLSMVNNRPSHKIANLPSWVPDFSDRDWDNPLAFPRDEVTIPYTASGMSAPKIDWQTDEPGILRIKGCEIDQVIKLASQKSMQGRWADADEEWRRLIDEYPFMYATGEPKDEAFWRTIIGNSTHPPHFVYPAPQEYFPADGISAESWEYFTNAKIDPDTPTQAEDIDPSPEPCVELADTTKDFMKAVERAMRHRRFFITEKGYFGAAPPSAQEGDSVCIFAGGKTPYLTRQTAGNHGENEETSSTNSFVGECYCHGIMDGEALKSDSFRWGEMRLS